MGFSRRLGRGDLFSWLRGRPRNSRRAGADQEPELGASAPQEFADAGPLPAVVEFDLEAVLRSALPALAPRARRARGPVRPPQPARASSRVVSGITCQGLLGGEWPAASGRTSVAVFPALRIRSPAAPNHWVRRVPGAGFGGRRVAEAGESSSGNAPRRRHAALGLHQPGSLNRSPNWIANSRLASGQ